MSAGDRATARSSHPQTSFFGGDAAAKIAFGDLAHDNPRAALVEAQRAVRTAPIDPSTTTALGSSLLTLGQLDRAYAAFAVAGTRSEERPVGKECVRTSRTRGSQLN